MSTTELRIVIARILDEAGVTLPDLQRLTLIERIVHACVVVRERLERRGGEPPNPFEQ